MPTGWSSNATGNVAVYDFGGGTFDISILSIKGGIFEVLATNGDTHLGGDDIDRVLVDFILAGQPEALKRDRHVWNSARRVAEDAKQRLSTALETELVLELPAGALRKSLSRADFERMAGPLVERTLKCCESALKDAKLDPSGDRRGRAGRRFDAHAAGAPARAGAVRPRAAMLGRSRSGGCDGRSGAGRRADGQSQGDMLLLDVVPLSLGIETMGGVMERMIHRNTTIPTSVAEMFTTAVDNQTHVDVHVLQGERELANDCRSLARFKLGPIDAQPAGMPRIEVTFLIDANGILNVTARDQRTGREHSVDVKPSYGLNEEEIERMLEEAIDEGEQDLEESPADYRAQLRPIRFWPRCANSSSSMRTWWMRWSASGSRIWRPSSRPRGRASTAKRWRSWSTS